jgi:di/tricarboxylate transporter
MTLTIALTLGILLVAIIIFVTEWIRPDLVALLILVILVITGLVTPQESISGFSNPAVVTIWAVFILSAGLARTGVASKLGEQVLRIAGTGENRLISVLITSTAFLSAFMNNIGVAAMFLPVTVDIARRTKHAASRLLMPMAYGSLLGGMLVLIGTASNLVVSDFLREAGMQPLGLFDFTPIGIVILIVVLVYMNLIGKRLIPFHKIPQPLSAAAGVSGNRDFRSLYGLEERLAMLSIPEESPLAGKTIQESRIGQALGLNVLSIERKTGEKFIPDVSLVLEAGDKLLVLGRLDQFEQISSRPLFNLESETFTLEKLMTQHIGLAEVVITDESPYTGKTLVETDLRRSHGVNVLAINRDKLIRRTNLQHIVLERGDRLLVEGLPSHLENLSDHPGYQEITLAEANEYQLDENLLLISIPADSALVGKSLKEARLGAAYGITVLNIIREGSEWRLPTPTMKIDEGDQLVVSGHPVDIEVLRGLQSIKIQPNVHADLESLEEGPLTIVEVMLSPYTRLAGKTLSDLHFRKKYGISVLAIWRGDRSYRTGLAEIPLHFGDALLCSGTYEQFAILARDPDFIVLKLDVQEKPLAKKAPLAAFIMLAVVFTVILNWLPISVAAIGGAALMVITRCLTMDEAYRAIEWHAVFLIAAMLPLGLAMQQTGAAEFLAVGVVNAVGPYGETAILAGLMLLTLLVNQFIPSAVNAVVMSPIALATAASLGVSPYPFIMGIAYAVASSFMTPVSHPANLLVMSPGGYRFTDYILNGLPISIIVLVVSVLLLPVVFPF